MSMARVTLLWKLLPLHACLNFQRLPAMMFSMKGPIQSASFPRNGLSWSFTPQRTKSDECFHVLHYGGLAQGNSQCGATSAIFHNMNCEWRNLNKDPINVCLRGAHNFSIASTHTQTNVPPNCTLYLFLCTSLIPLVVQFQVLAMNKK